MASGKGINSLVRRVGTKSAFESALQVVSSSSNWAQGDFLSWDGTNKIINTSQSLSDTGANFLGIAQQSVTNGVVNDPYQGLTDTSPAAQDLVGPEYGDIHNVQLKNGDTATPGCYLYPDYTAGATRQVTVTAGMLAPIGVYQGAQITAGSSTQIQMLVGCQFPNNVLKF